MHTRAGQKIVLIDRDHLDAAGEVCCLCGRAIRDREVPEAVRMEPRTDYRDLWRHGHCLPWSDPEDAA